MRPSSDHLPADGNVVPFPLPRRATPREAERATPRADDVEASAHDRAGAVVTLVLFVLASLFNAALLLAAFGARLP